MASARGHGPPALLVLVAALLGPRAPQAQAGDCKGQRQVLREAPGYVSDGAGNYSVNGNCEWLIEAPSPQHRILLDFLFLDTECTYDYLFVYDGDSPRGPLLASLSGSTRPPRIEAASGKMLLHLFSDANYNLLGFNASFSFSLCPGGCSGRGLCEPSGQCACEPGWGGPGCTRQDCSSYCREHGTCASEAGPCRCEPGFLGRACDLRLWENQGAGWWHNVSAEDAAFPARIGAAGAFLSPPGLLAVFGGQDLNSALGDLVLYNFSANAWERWDLSPGPAARHSHVAVAWAGSLVLMGGELADGSLTSDVWAFSPRAGGHWELLAPPSSGPPGPPGLAGHAAALVDDSWLYVFGGRTQHDLFSSGLFRFRLEGPGGGRGHWEEVWPAGGRPPAATGHSMIFHPPSRALLVYGGHRPSTARFSVRVNSTELFHVDLRVWTSLRGRDGQRGPRERAFHTASVLGNYMVVYGGNVHTHYQEEKCYEDGIFFYHLGCHQWVSGAELAPPGTPEGRAAPPGGRYSHVAAVLGGSVLLVAGGYSGRPRGDLMAYKVPPFVFQAPAPDYHLDYCSMYTEHSVCARDPECSWCQGACQAAPPPGSPPGACPAAGCLGLARLLGDCQACLAFSAAVPPPRGPGALGWCVHNESCLPRPEQARCRGEQISGTVGWWGAAPVFVTTLDACVTQSFLPGLHLLTFQQPPNASQPDKVRGPSGGGGLGPKKRKKKKKKKQKRNQKKGGGKNLKKKKKGLKKKKGGGKKKKENSQKIKKKTREKGGEKNPPPPLFPKGKNPTNPWGPPKTPQKPPPPPKKNFFSPPPPFPPPPPQFPQTPTQTPNPKKIKTPKNPPPPPNPQKFFWGKNPPWETPPPGPLKPPQRPNQNLNPPRETPKGPPGPPPPPKNPPPFFFFPAPPLSHPFFGGQGEPPPKPPGALGGKGPGPGPPFPPRGPFKGAPFFRVSRGPPGDGGPGAGSCPAPQECVPEEAGGAGVGRCRCPPGWAGPACTLALCPGNCSAHIAGGICNQSLGLCVCFEGFGGADCATHLDGGRLVWETLLDSRLSADTASRFLHRLGHTMVEGPDSTLWMFGGLGLPQGLLGNLYRYSVGERRMGGPGLLPLSHGPGPRPRWPGPCPRGLTAAGVARDFWVLNLTTLQWRQEELEGHPPLAFLCCLGGIWPENGFNQQLLEVQPSGPGWPAPGTPLRSTGVHHEGHRLTVCLAAFHSAELAAPSPELYSLHCPDRTWSLLAPSQGAKPRPRLFHAAALLGDTMVVLGGRSEPDEFSSDVLLYQVNCNAWLLPNLTREESVAHAVAAVGGRVYISGGFGGVALGRLLSLSLPSDPCHLVHSPEACNGSGACSWCHGACLSGDQAHRLGCSSPSCSPMPRTSEECRRLRTCSECLARHPRTLRLGEGEEAAPPRCKWCTNCPEGACIGRNGSCTSENDCRINQREVFWAGNCSEAACGAADCEQCTQEGKCMWTRQFKRTGETRRILSVQPTYDWTCFSHSLLNVSPMPVESSPPMPCPTPCHRLPNCSSCLDSKGADGGWQHCVWSSSLQQCLSPSFLPLRCLAGGCGRLLRGAESCSLGCGNAPQCALCLRRPHCGWCARGDPGQDGAGLCMEGGLSGPRNGLTCGHGDPGATWAFLSCPPENECVNGHHDCNETQNCHDRPHGYECTCKTGYTMDHVRGQCRPVCAQGCVNGSCVEPDHCLCHFGFVGRNCSTECRCNRHSNCDGVGARDRCLECHNNTAGPHCERCRPLFVGSALGGGTCRPCRAFCRGNSDICVSEKELEMARDDPETYSLDPEEIEKWVSEGPSEDEAVCVNCQNNSYGDKCQRCLEGYFLLDGRCTKCQCNGHADTCNEDGTGCPCQNNTETGTCQGSSPNDRRDCYKYQCAKCRESFHGSPLGGQQCYRLISVEQECCLDPTSQTNCFHEPKRRALGPGRTVLFGVQPKFTNVDIRLTLDVTFGAVDLYVSTSYDTFVVRVDPDTGVHSVHIQPPPPAPPPVAAEAGLRAGEAGAGGPGPPPEPRVREVRPRGLITYVTVMEPAAVLVVRGVRDRLVITYPHEQHALKSSRFYLLLLGVGDPSAPGANGSADSQGLLFFRQDQAHIDLFVFFSVFFSCFFLFLSLCVLLWKAKQALDQRREQRRHLQEMTKMASRPFAKVTVCFPPEPAVTVPWKTSGMGLPAPAFRRSEPFLAPLLLTGGGGPWGAGSGGCCPVALRAGPITLEPTEDGMAGVATLLLQLPGGIYTPNRACLGSALVTLRHRLQEYCGGGAGPGASGHGAGGGRKGLLTHDNLTSMSL
uniref:Multiple EGF like domains 8 n=1 Tax=Sarcophilus harrisii TaxID=9305 RepID=A0A7N4V4Y0_SARHA